MRMIGEAEHFIGGSPNPPYKVPAADERLWVHVVGQLGGLPFVAGEAGAKPRAGVGLRVATLYSDVDHYSRWKP